MFILLSSLIDTCHLLQVPRMSKPKNIYIPLLAAAISWTFLSSSTTVRMISADIAGILGMVDVCLHPGSRLLIGHSRLLIGHSSLRSLRDTTSAPRGTAGVTIKW